MKFVTIKLLLSFLLVALTLTAQHAYAEGKIIKWVDDKGVTHYGDKPPMPDESKRQSSVLNKQGITIDKTNKEIEPETAATENNDVSDEQKRYDRALLASYASIEEIELARKRNVRIDELTLEVLMQKRRNMQAEPPEQFDKVALQKMEQQIRDQQKVIADINQRYENDKKRFTDLKTSRNN